MRKIISIILCIIICIATMTVAVAEDINLAYEPGVNVFLKSHSGAMLPASANNVAKNAIDENLSTTACAAVEWAWTFEMDLGKEYESIGKVALTFGEGRIPTDYEILLSVDGGTWISAVKISGNDTFERRVHEFSSIPARYVRVKDLVAYVGISQMHIAEIEVYEGVAGSVGISLLNPQPDAVGVAGSEKIVLIAGGEFPTSYLAAINLYDKNGVVECDKSVEGNVITLTPKKLLASGEYTVDAGGENVWSFLVTAENLTRKAKVQMVSVADEVAGGQFPAGVTPTPAENAIDGDKATYAALYYPFEGYKTYNQSYYFELDFGRPYENMNYVEITVPTGVSAGQIEIQISDDGLNWRKVHRFYQLKRIEIKESFPPVTARYMRLFQRDGNGLEFKLAEFNVRSIKNEESPTAVVVVNGKANGDIAVNFSDGIDMSTAEGIVLEKDGKIIPCEYISEENGTRIIVRPKSGLDYGTSYKISVTDKVKSVWGVSAKSTSLKFLTEKVQPLEITTKSSSEYAQYKEKAIYPAFVDNMPYESWTEDGKKAYYQIKADGGKAPYTFEITKGSLPDGLSMDKEGKISGTPIKEGDFAFTVRVTDYTGTTADKELIMESNPYRGKWFYDARIGVMTHASPSGYPRVVTNKETIADFEKRITEYDAEEWVKQISEMGVTVLNYKALGSDGIRMWPSTSPSRYDLHTEKDYVSEIVDACHRYGIKVVTYIAPDNGGIGLFELDPHSGTYSDFTINHTRELLRIGVDGVWFDSGFRIGTTDWEKLIAVIRTENPYVTIETNGGVGTEGYLPQYPDVDIQAWEGPANTDFPNTLRVDHDLYTGYRGNVRKKIGLDITTLIGPGWGYNGNDKEYETKPTEEIISVIQGNWDRDATVMLVWPIPPNWQLVHPKLEPGLTKIVDWVKENIVPTDTPVASLESGEYTGAQTLKLSGNGKIYYTTDGSLPDENSTLYTEPIVIDDSVRIKAAAFEEGKGKSRIMHKDYIINKERELVRLTDAEPKIELKTTRSNRMAGYALKVGANPLKVHAVGRYDTGDTDTRLFTIMPLGDTYQDPLLYSQLDMSKGETDEYGFKYTNIPTVILEPLKTYYILCEEKKGTQYAHLVGDGLKLNNSSYIGPAVTGEYMTRIMTTQKYNAAYSDLSEYQQFLNIKYEVLPAPDGINEKNLAYTARLALLDNDGNRRNPSAFTAFAENATDNDLTTHAAAGEAWAWTLHTDLGKPVTDIETIIVHMKEKGYATKYEISYSSDNIEWTKIVSVKNNHTGGTKKHTVEPFTARYIRIRSLAPNDRGQEGGQMQVAELEIYRTDEAYNKEDIIYKDIDTVEWAQGYIYEVTNAGVMCGTAPQIFEPGRGITKAEMAKVLTKLFALEGTKTDFADVDEDAWYTPYTLEIWGEGEYFNPDMQLSRAQAAVMIYRAVKESGAKYELKYNNPECADTGDLNEEEMAAVKFMMRCGIMSADSEGYFEPHTMLTRAMASKILSLLGRGN